MTKMRGGQFILFCFWFCSVITVSEAWNNLMESPDNYEGDIILNENQTTLLNSPFTFGLSKADGWNKHWPKNVPIAYEFSDEFKGNSNKKYRIQKALKDYEDNTCLRFVPRTNQKHFLHFRNGNGCSSMVGMQYTGNFINLAPGCFGHSTLLHEIAHSLGVWHEQSRGDRDKYIKINYHNMKCCASQFKERGYSIDSLGFEYDLKSMMHYSPWAFSNGKGPTIEALDGSKQIGNRQGFSKIDLAQLNAMYCENRVTTTTKRPTSAPRGKIIKQASSQKCLDIDQNNQLTFSSRCQTRLEVMEGKLFSSKDYKCAVPLSHNSESNIHFVANCDEGFRKININGKFFNIQHKGTGKCIHPNGGSSNPKDGTKAVIFHSCNGGKRIQFEEV